MKTKSILIFALVLLATSFSARAAEWKLLGKLGNKEVYVDQRTLRDTGNGIRLWVLVSYDEPRPAPNGEHWQSMKSRILLDCEEETALIQYAVFNNKPKNEGDDVYTDPAVYVPTPAVPGTLPYTLVMAFCR